MIKPIQHAAKFELLFGEANMKKSQAAMKELMEKINEEGKTWTCKECKTTEAHPFVVMARYELDGHIQSLRMAYDANPPNETRKKLFEDDFRRTLFVRRLVDRENLLYLKSGKIIGNQVNVRNKSGKLVEGVNRVIEQLKEMKRAKAKKKGSHQNKNENFFHIKAIRTFVEFYDRPGTNFSILIDAKKYAQEIQRMHGSRSHRMRYGRPVRPDSKSAINTLKGRLGY